jgi:predicted nucleotidyltransferase component of viral defense system
MIAEHCYSQEWLESFKKQKEHQRIDKIILEKMIYALHLLEQLKINGLEFVFKGGTSLILLLEEGNRFSIDIDIICQLERTEIEKTLDVIVKNAQFNNWTLDEHRSYQEGVPKAHYKFHFDTKQQGSGTILLDILFEEVLYPDIIELPVETKWIETNEPTLIQVPSIDAITGDKLTAFAPNTIGIPYYKGEVLFTMEICKQLFDLSKLFEHVDDVGVVADSFFAFAKQEIEYRKSQSDNLDLTPESVLLDTIDTCLIIAKRGSGSVDEKNRFADLQKGIKAFGSGFLMSGSFRIDDAVLASARIAYLASKLLKNDLSPIIKYEDQNVKELNIKKTDWSFLNRLKRQPDKSSFFYWFKTVDLLTKQD